MELYRWLSDHWVEILTYMGISGAAGIGGGKLIDREQNRKIKELETTVGINSEALQAHKEWLIRLEKDMEKNVAFDKELRESLKGTFARLDTRLDRIETLIMELAKK